MTLYRKKSGIVEAVQWFKPGDHPDVVNGKFNKVGGSIFDNVTIDPGDYIVTDEYGDVYVISKKCFEAFYEKVPTVTGEGCGKDTPNTDAPCDACQQKEQLEDLMKEERGKEQADEAWQQLADEERGKEEGK